MGPKTMSAVTKTIMSLIPWGTKVPRVIPGRLCLSRF